MDGGASCSYVAPFYSGGPSSSFSCDGDAEKDLIFGEDVDLEKVPLSFDINKGDQYGSKLILKKLMHLIVVRGNFEFHVVRSNNDFYTVSYYDAFCKWIMRASRVCGRDLWIVRKYISPHTCPRDIISNEHRQASHHFIGELLKWDFSRGIFDKAFSKDVMSYIYGKHDVEISYYVASKARCFALDAIRGTTEQSYSLIPSLCAVLWEKNPGSFTAYELDTEGRFLYFFMCLSASIQGWRHCRPVIYVDGSFLKTEYCGTLLLALALDGNNHIFPLAFGIIDNETDRSWEWFLLNLKQAIGNREELVIVSDRKGSIPKVVDSWDMHAISPPKYDCEI